MFLWCPSYLRGLSCSFPSVPGNFEDNIWFNKPRPFNLDFIFLSYFQNFTPKLCPCSVAQNIHLNAFKSFVPQCRKLPVEEDNF